MLFVLHNLSHHLRLQLILTHCSYALLAVLRLNPGYDGLHLVLSDSALIASLAVGRHINASYLLIWLRWRDYWRNLAWGRREGLSDVRNIGVCSFFLLFFFHSGKSGSNDSSLLGFLDWLDVSANFGFDTAVQLLGALSCYLMHSSRLPHSLYRASQHLSFLIFLNVFLSNACAPPQEIKPLLSRHLLLQTFGKLLSYLLWWSWHECILDKFEWQRNYLLLIIFIQKFAFINFWFYLFNQFNYFILRNKNKF